MLLKNSLLVWNTHNKKLNCAIFVKSILQCLKAEAESLKAGYRKKGFILVMLVSTPSILSCLPPDTQN